MTHSTHTNLTKATLLKLKQTTPKQQKETYYFPQFRTGTSWLHISEITKDKGYATIESCQEAIDKSEQKEIKAGIKNLTEWRIKEEQV